MNRIAKHAFMIGMGFTVIALVVLGIFMITSSGDRTLAAEGCCMERACPDDSCTWYVIQGDYDECKRINDDRDGDDVESESGLIWWSLDC